MQFVPQNTNSKQLKYLYIVKLFGAMPWENLLRGLPFLQTNNTLMSNTLRTKSGTYF
jgi:hypothetical protein